MAHTRHISKLPTIARLALVALLCVLVTSVAGAAERRNFSNGINATIFTPAEIMGQMKSTGDGVVEIITPNGALTLTGDTADMVPFELSYVERALESMHGLATKVDVVVYILPAIPKDVGGSFARHDVIYLAPGTAAVDESTVAYITTHEMGHVLTWAFMDSYPSRWDAYLTMRGLDLDTNGPLAAHADRSREILAEDIRHLFGGWESTISGSIENHDLVLPERVDGLLELLAGFFAGRDADPVAVTSSAFPNPCNPLTTIAMVVPEKSAVAGNEAILRVFDIRGALVKTVSGGNLANSRITIQWNGSTNSGTAAASGRYLYVLQVGSLIAKGTVTMVR